MNEVEQLRAQLNAQAQECERLREAAQAAQEYITGWTSVAPDVPLHPADKQGHEAQECLDLLDRALHGERG